MAWCTCCKYSRKKSFCLRRRTTASHWLHSSKPSTIWSPTMMKQTSTFRFNSWSIRPCLIPSMLKILKSRSLSQRRSRLLHKNLNLLSKKQCRLKKRPMWQSNLRPLWLKRTHLSFVNKYLKILTTATTTLHHHLHRKKKGRNSSSIKKIQSMKKRRYLHLSKKKVQDRQSK